jgi:hypothetical protein
MESKEGDPWREGYECLKMGEFLERILGIGKGP